MGKATQIAKRAKYHAVIADAMNCARQYPQGHIGRIQWSKVARIMNWRMIKRLRKH